MADAWSGGGEAAKGPASCIAPYPDRRTCIWPSAKVDIMSASSVGSGVDIHAVAEVQADRLQDRKSAGDSEHIHGPELAGVLLDDGRGGSIGYRVQVALHPGPEVLPVLPEVRSGVHRTSMRVLWSRKWM